MPSSATTERVAVGEGTPSKIRKNMNELVEKLLKAVSAEQPCGPDLSSNGQFDQLETILKGKPEVEIGSIHKPAEPPDWKELADRSTQFLDASKHLRVATMFCGSMLYTRGVPGFCDGVQLIRGLLEQYWAALYPLLDPDDGNDPTQRLNILGSLTVPRGSSGWLAIIDGLYAAPVCRPKGGAPITFDQILAARENAVGSEATPGNPTASGLAAALRDAGSEEISKQRAQVQQALEAIEGIDKFLTTTLGAGNTISFEGVEKVLREMLSALDGYMSEGGAAPGATANAADGNAPGEASAINVRGSIRSREDVVRAIDNICAYYDQVEPSSPVPYLLRRAQKVARMNFVEAVQELNLATTDSLRPSMGSAVPDSPQQPV
jgi:type VI secretion system protein ImpA